MQEVGILENLQKSLALKEGMLSYEMLGKSLSYNPYLPRVISKTKNYVFVTPSEVLEKLLQENTHTDCVIINFKGLYELGVPSVFDLEVLGLLRRHASSMIVQQDFFISHYQLLESLVQGTDGVILDEGLLKEDLKGMIDFACRLGLSVFVETDKPNHAYLKGLGVLGVLEKISHSQNQKKIVFLD
ncbi:beta/alpha barrel domain-containing protein [Helicobacter acinonychis]|uniref:Indole-3-glycerol phosphate synthase n=1 Tax=Helicobacter acinonychis (strain Sheeba) TaxID=382638 RepID=Q17YC0_HELAH|nr:indole-3-glycerol-phosphate synthase [Helicobacter acinonychis]CAJ99356.1 indole-3-glycerol phosphate synthase [Helicobacter acinonychis str. Sheeba]STP03936.1 indole-3-glycerol phosphate synthase [Helicobacter acinonychis]